MKTNAENSEASPHRPEPRSRPTPRETVFEAAIAERLRDSNWEKKIAGRVLRAGRTAKRRSAMYGLSAAAATVLIALGVWLGQVGGFGNDASGALLGGGPEATEQSPADDWTSAWDPAFAYSGAVVDPLQEDLATEATGELLMLAVFDE
jgi:hypothetical protein